jgi:multicomponent Na+:H+ antiporter subunit E
MNVLAFNLVLALIWMFAWGDMSPAMFTVGFVLAYILLAMMRPLLGETTYFAKLPSLIRLAAFVLYELVLSSLRIAWDVVTPRAFRTPGIVAVPLDAETDLEIAVVANLVTLTPGTLSLEVVEASRTLYVHSMFAGDPEDVRTTIKKRFEAPVLELLR